MDIEDSSGVAIGSIEGCWSSGNCAIAVVNGVAMYGPEGILCYSGTCRQHPISTKYICFGDSSSTHVRIKITEEMYNMLNEMNEIVIEDGKSVYRSRIDYYNLHK